MSALPVVFLDSKCGRCRWHWYNYCHNISNQLRVIPSMLWMHTCTCNIPLCIITILYNTRTMRLIAKFNYSIPWGIVCKWGELFLITVLLNVVYLLHDSKCTIDPGLSCLSEQTKCFPCMENSHESYNIYSMITSTHCTEERFLFWLY